MPFPKKMFLVTVYIQGRQTPESFHITCLHSEKSPAVWRITQRFTDNQISFTVEDDDRDFVCFNKDKVDYFLLKEVEIPK